MRVHGVGTFPELVDGPAVAVVLEVSVEEAKAMALLLFEEVSLVAGNPDGCRFEECHRESVVCASHYEQSVQEATVEPAAAAVRLGQHIETLTRAARLVLGALAAERSGGGHHPGLIPVTDSRAKALAQLLGDPS